MFKVLVLLGFDIGLALGFILRIGNQIELRDVAPVRSVLPRL